MPAEIASSSPGLPGTSCPAAASARVCRYQPRPGPPLSCCCHPTSCRPLGSRLWPGLISPHASSSPLRGHSWPERPDDRCAPSFQGDPATHWDGCCSIHWRWCPSATTRSSRRMAELSQREPGRWPWLLKPHPLQAVPGLKPPCPPPKAAPQVARVQGPGLG